MDADDDVVRLKVKRNTTLRRQNLPKKAVSKQGLMQIRDGLPVLSYFFRSWRTVWAVLDAHSLTFYRAENDQQTPKLVVPLLQSYVAHAAEQSVPDRALSLSLRTAAGDDVVCLTPSIEDAKEWIGAIRNNAKMLDVELMAQLKMPDAPPGAVLGDVLKMAWVHERLSGSSTWRWRYLVMTDFSVAVYDRAPGASAALAKHLVHIPLFECKHRELGADEFVEIENRRPFTFVIVADKETYLFSTETRVELRNWVSALDATTVNTLLELNEFSFSGIADGVPVTLTIRPAEGFAMINKTTGAEIWRYPFAHFKTARPKRTSLLLDFGKYADRVFEVTLADSTTRAVLVITNIVDAFGKMPTASAKGRAGGGGGGGGTASVAGNNRPEGAQEASLRERGAHVAAGVE